MRRVFCRLAPCCDSDGGGGGEVVHLRHQDGVGADKVGDTDHRRAMVCVCVGRGGIGR